MRHREIGSLWGKWDLHLHTPSSFDYHNKQITDAEIIDTLVQSEVQVAAITDHHTIDVAKIASLQALAGDKVTILPGIEFRTELGGKEVVHLIGIFSEDCNVQDIWTKLSGKLNLTASDIQASGGDEKIYVDFKETADIIRECGGVVTVHAGRKTNSIESIGNNEKFKMALKTDLARDYIDIYEIGNTKDIQPYKETVFPSIGVEKPLIICSDNHNIEKYSVSTNCWIKGDPSFRTFQQLESEPSRAFIGMIPDEVVRVQANKTKYISMIEFKKVQNSKLTEEWFSGSVPINSGLVAIIGNKGSGKTALAETIGLLGNCAVSGAFSFLNDKKFKQQRNNKAKEFKARITWVNGHQEIHLLDDAPDLLSPQSVSYIPQNHLETICNEVDNRAGSQFDQELKSVIFSHVPEDKKLTASSLDELLQFINEPLESNTHDLRQELHELNALWLVLKSQSLPAHRQLLLNLLQSKQRELDAHDKIKPEDMKEPGADPQNQEEHKKLREEIDSRNAQRVQIAQNIKNSEALTRTASAQIASAKRVAQTLKNFQASYEALIKGMQADCGILGLNAKALVTLNVDYTQIQKVSSLAQQVTDEQSQAVIAFNAQAGTLKAEIENLTAQLDAPNIAYQQYLERLKTWEEQRAAIVGDVITAETIENVKQRIDELDDLPMRIAEVEKQRTAKVKEIFSNIELVVNNYKEHYHPVQDFIAKHPVAHKQFNMEFSASIHTTGLEANFLGKLNQGRKGSFNGLEEGRAALSNLVATADIQTPDGAVGFADELLSRLEHDFRTTPKSQSVLENQLRDHVDAVDVLDYIFGLEYLKPQYQLKWSGKSIDELSPGERGTLLLIFYLLIDKRDIPLIIDQPEENLDNETVFDTLVPCLREARSRRQVIIVTHNPNLAVVCDADQIVHAQIDKHNGNKVTYTPGALENPKMNEFCISVLEGTRPAFDKRDSKYQSR